MGNHIERETNMNQNGTMLIIHTNDDIYVEEIVNQSPNQIKCVLKQYSNTVRYELISKEEFNHRLDRLVEEHSKTPAFK